MNHIRLLNSKLLAGICWARSESSESLTVFSGKGLFTASIANDERMESVSKNKSHGKLKLSKEDINLEYILFQTPKPANNTVKP